MSIGIGHVYTVLSTGGEFTALRRIPSSINRSVSLDFADTLIKNADLVVAAKRIIERWHRREMTIKYQTSSSCLPKFFFKHLNQEI